MCACVCVHVYNFLEIFFRHFLTTKAVEVGMAVAMTMTEVGCGSLGGGDSDGSDRLNGGDDGGVLTSAMEVVVVVAVVVGWYRRWLVAAVVREC